jgi:hypothetical protein
MGLVAQSSFLRVGAFHLRDHVFDSRWGTHGIYVKRVGSQGSTESCGLFPGTLVSSQKGMSTKCGLE